MLLGRVDALKSCLEEEREKSKHLTDKEKEESEHTNVMRCDIILACYFRLILLVIERG